MINQYYDRIRIQGRRFPFGNPLANALVVVVGTLVVAISVVLGFIAFVAVGSLLMVAGGIIGLRLWWLNRRLSAAPSGNSGVDDAGVRVRAQVIEGEFRELPPGPARSDTRRRP